MKNNNQITFSSPSFITRIKGMLSVDFYRLFHTPLFYIFLAIAAIIPAMILSTTTMGDGGVETAKTMYTNVWQIIASDSPLYVFSGIGEYANMNMVFIFGGIMLSIFIGHDYRSGYVKQLFTTHPKKQDYMISKTIIGAVSMASMCVAYLIGTMLAGLFVGMSFSANFWSVVCAVIGKILMSLGWASLYVFLNVIFRKFFGISIASSFFLGTGILVIAAAAILGNNSLLNIFLYGSSVYACLSSSITTIIICFVVSIIWTIIYNLLGTYVLSKSDVY